MSKRGIEMGGERRGGEESENRSLVSLLLYFTVALLPAGDIHKNSTKCT